MYKSSLILLCCFFSTGLFAMKTDTYFDFSKKWLDPSAVDIELEKLAKQDYITNLNFSYPAKKIKSKREDKLGIWKDLCCDMTLGMYDSDKFNSVDSFLKLTQEPPSLFKYLWVFEYLPNLEKLSVDGLTSCDELTFKMISMVCEKLQEIRGDNGRLLWTKK